jgi:uncharacterized protein YhbP (UPF0306 family)
MDESKNTLLTFLKNQKLLVLASKGEDVWVANVYFGIGEDFKIYFVGGEDAKHSQQIIQNPQIAYSVSWFNPDNHKDRKAIQGTGFCRAANSDKEITEGIRLHNLHFPEFKERITVDYINNNYQKSRVWVIEPNFMKFWNDELFGENGTEEFQF